MATDLPVWREKFLGGGKPGGCTMLTRNKIMLLYLMLSEHQARVSFSSTSAAFFVCAWYALGNTQVSSTQRSCKLMDKTHCSSSDTENMFDPIAHSEKLPVSLMSSMGI